MQPLHPVLFQRAGRMEKQLFFHFVKMCQLAYTPEVGLLEPASATTAAPPHAGRHVFGMDPRPDWV